MKSHLSRCFHYDYKFSTHPIRRQYRSSRNAYGPTETTIWSVLHCLSPKESRKPVPIGQAIAGWLGKGTSCEVFDVSRISLVNCGEQEGGDCEIVDQNPGRILGLWLLKLKIGPISNMLGNRCKNMAWDQWRSDVLPPINIHQQGQRMVVAQKDRLCWFPMKQETSNQFIQNPNPWRTSIKQVFKTDPFGQKGPSRHNLWKSTRVNHLQLLVKKIRKAYIALSQWLANVPRASRDSPAGTCCRRWG